MLFNDDFVAKSNLSQPLKINIDKLIQSYFIEFIQLLYKEASVKFPKDPMIQLSYSYFALACMHNIFVSLNVLRCFHIKHLSIFEKFNYKVNESYLIYQMRNILK